MPRYAIIWLIGCSAVSSFGCLTKQFAHDGVAIHEAMIDVYTDQAMMNLIRARANIPFVQLTYSKITINDKGIGKGNAGVDQTLNTTRDLLVKAATRTLTNVYTLGAGVDDNRIMSFNADPVLGQNDIYNQYVAFARDPNLFVVSEDPPGCAAHVVRKYCGKHYWVPVEAGPAFLALVLRTSVMRGPDQAPVIPAAYDVMVLNVINVKHIKDKAHDYFNGTLVLDGVVPNGDGLLLVNLRDGRQVRISVMPFDDLRVSVATSKIDVQWPPDFADKDFKGQSARLYSYDYPPETWRQAQPPQGLQGGDGSQARATFAAPY